MTLDRVDAERRSSGGAIPTRAATSAPTAAASCPRRWSQPIEALERAYLAARATIRRSATSSSRLLRHFVGRPDAALRGARGCPRTSAARVFLKREDLAHTGAHKINNALGQALLAKRMGKTPRRRRDRRRPARRRHGDRLRAARPRVRRLHGHRGHGAAGAERRPHAAARRRRCVGVDAGSRTLKDAINEAMRDWVANVARHALPARLGARAASVSADGARVPVGHRPGGAAADPGAGRPAARRGRRLRRRRQQRHRPLRRLHRRRRRCG